jgi:general stress protein 26
VSSRALLSIAAAAVLFLPIAAAARTDPQERERAQVAAFEVMQAARFATLVTLGGDGHPQGRIVDPLVAGDRTIWVATNPLSRKVGEIRRDPRVTLVFFNAGANEYVTVRGRARAVTDARTRAVRWKPEWEPFYKARHEGKDFMLLEVVPLRYEISSARLGLANDPLTWKPVVIETGRK